MIHGRGRKEQQRTRRKQNQVLHDGAGPVATVDDVRRKSYFDAVQQIVWEQEPFLYLLNKDALAAISPRLRNVQASVLRPQLIWNVERLWLAPGR